MRLASETRRPGMIAERHCLSCRALLQADNAGDRCFECQLPLSAKALTAGTANRLRRAELAARERELHNLKIMIGRIERRLRKWRRLSEILQTSGPSSC